MVTLDEALDYLGYDYPDDVITRNVTRQLDTAVKTLHGAVGEDVDLLMPDDPRAKELVLTYLDDLHTNRGLSAKVSGSVRLSVASMELQLRLELRELREGVKA